MRQIGKLGSKVVRIATLVGVLVLGGAPGGCATVRPATLQPASVSLGGEKSANDPIALDSPANLKTRKLLEAPGDCVAVNEHFSTVIKSIEKESGASMEVNWRALEAAGIDRNTPVSLRYSGVPLRRILTSVLSDVGGGSGDLGWTVDDGVICVSTRDDLNSAKYQCLRTYDIGLILDTIDPAELTNLIILQTLYPYNGFVPPPPPATSEQEIIDTIKTTIAPDSWRDAGGEIGSLHVVKGVLIVNQIPDNQRQIAKLINDLRETAEARTRAYDVRDIVGTDDKKLRELMDLVEGLSPQRMWVAKGGAMGVMRGMGGYLYVSGANHVHDEVAMQLRAIRAAGAGSRKMNLVTPTLVPAPPRTMPPPAPATPAPATAPK